eukprot:m.231438 g.231438  ORF g.231438 m.231438 type:complete len:55 (+) comp40494_c0_seq1:74-238(+)
MIQIMSTQPGCHVCSDAATEQLLQTVHAVPDTTDVTVGAVKCNDSGESRAEGLG